ncbi:MAG: hypothetical protein BGN82_02335 [Alphaproteobacteria bacterium 65-7]|nr:MAG: hypothetical protein BGN82_02335 [Alphaproteobacteria bacterium 65-7]
MKHLAALVVLACAATAQAQAATQPASALDDRSHHIIGNGLVRATVFPPGENALYRGTRFDHAGIVMHVTYQGQDYSDWWFDRFVTDPRDTSRQPPGTVTACCAVSGPVEEFAAVGFEEAGTGGRFLKPGIGIFRRDNDDPLRFPTLPGLNTGTRGFTATATGAHFTHDLDDPLSGYGYHYDKRVELVPGQPRMVISHLLTNTGTKPIVTTVFNHNFLTLSPGNAHIQLTAPFALKNEKPLPPELAVVEGKALRYRKALTPGETVQSPFTGFGATPRDYDFRVVNTATGFGQRIRADQPIARINLWSIHTNFSWEPYIAIALKPGESKRWTYTYDFFGPGNGKKPK